jgi:TPM domain
VISSTTCDQLNALCAEVERKTGAQIAVVTVRSLEGQPIENYAVDLFKHLGVGRKDNRGILLLVAPNDRRYRFEVGYGLEPVINDARAGDIGREMIPLLRQNDYSAAVQLAVGRVANIIAEASKPISDPVKLSGIAGVLGVQAAMPSHKCVWLGCSFSHRGLSGFNQRPTVPFDRADFLLRTRVEAGASATPHRFYLRAFCRDKLQR